MPYSKKVVARPTRPVEEEQDDFINIVESSASEDAPVTTAPDDFSHHVADVLGIRPDTAQELIQGWDREYDDEPRSDTPSPRSDIASPRFYSTQVDEQNGQRRIRASSNHYSPPSFSELSLPAWEVEERERVSDLFFRQMDFRLRWIFRREEREGFSRSGRYGVTPFSFDDFKSKVRKAGKPHELNTTTSTFYDWHMGATDFLLRMESVVLNNNPCMRCHIIYKPTGKELCYQDRVWDGEKYSEVDMKWADA